MKNYLELADFFHEATLEERLLGIAKRTKKIRKRRGLTQAALADKSSVSYGTVKRFEQSGQISLESLFRLALALGIDNELDKLFASVPPTYEEMQHGR